MVLVPNNAVCVGIKTMVLHIACSSGLDINSMLHMMYHGKLQLPCVSRSAESHTSAAVHPDYLWPGGRQYV